MDHRREARLGRVIAQMGGSYFLTEMSGNELLDPASAYRLSSVYLHNSARRAVIALSGSLASSSTVK